MPTPDLPMLRGAWRQRDCGAIDRKQLYGGKWRARGERRVVLGSAAASHPIRTGRNGPLLL